MSLFGEPSSKQQVSDFGTSTLSLSTRRIPTGRLCLKIEPPANLTDVTFPPNSPHDQQPSLQRVRCAAAVEKSLEMIVMVLLRGVCIPTIGVVRSTVRTRRHRSRARWRDSLPVISCHLKVAAICRASMSCSRLERNGSHCASVSLHCLRQFQGVQRNRGVEYLH